MKTRILGTTEIDCFKKKHNIADFLLGVIGFFWVSLYFTIPAAVVLLIVYLFTLIF
ncbi:MAG: hypothetical protein WA061_02020 [Microgenomates group bacterium]